MGWFVDDGQEHSYDHEGYLEAMVREDGVWRALGLDDAPGGERPICHLRLACDCGWRSQRMGAPAGTTWWPCLVSFRGCIGDSQIFDDVACDLWKTQHRDQVTASSPEAFWREAHARRSARAAQRLAPGRGSCTECGAQGDQPCSLACPAHAFAAPGPCRRCGTGLYHRQAIQGSVVGGAS